LPTHRRTKSAGAKALGRLYIALESPFLELRWSVFDGSNCSTPALGDLALALAWSTLSNSRSPVLRSLIPVGCAPITALPASARCALLNGSSSASPALVSGSRATVRLRLPGASFAASRSAALPFLLLLLFFTLGHVLLRNMVRCRLRWHSNEHRYRNCGTGKALHRSFPKSQPQE
jgi:hypothetical protein